MSIVAKSRDRVLVVGLNRPEKRNALDRATADELSAVLAAAQRREPTVLVIHSMVPGMFVAGADIAELIERGADDALESINAGLCEQIESYRWPTIAVVDGPALGGGCELALACDFRLASARARFAQPELSLGIIAGAGANWRLPQVVGLTLARRMLYTGAMLNAEEALAAGLVESLHESEDLMDAALNLAANIARQSWRALELTKLALRQNRPSTTLFDITAQALLFESDTKRRRMSRFLERRREGERADPPCLLADEDD